MRIYYKNLSFLSPDLHSCTGQVTANGTDNEQTKRTWNARGTDKTFHERIGTGHATSMYQTRRYVRNNIVDQHIAIDLDVTDIVKKMGKINKKPVHRVSDSIHPDANKMEDE